MWIWWCIVGNISWELCCCKPKPKQVKLNKNEKENIVKKHNIWRGNVI